MQQCAQRQARQAHDERVATHILANVRRSLGVDGRRTAPRRAVVANGWPARRAGVIPARGQLAGARARRRCSATMAEKLDASVERRGERRRGARGGRRLSARPQPAAIGAHGRRPAARRPALGTASRARGRHGPSRRRRRGRRQPRLRRRRRDRHAGAWSPAPTIRRRSTSCPTTTSSCSTRPTIAGDLETALAGIRARYRQGRDAAHRQLGHRPVALRRHRADAAPRRAWPARAAPDRGRRIIGWGRHSFPRRARTR